MYWSRNDLVEALRGVDLSVRQREIHGVIGESGSGKTSLCDAVLGDLSAEPGIVAGRIVLNGQNLLEGIEKCCRLEKRNGARVVRKDVGGWERIIGRRFGRLRGNEVSWISQHPGTALDPMRTVRAQVMEVLRSKYQSLEGKALDKAAADWLSRVLLDPDQALGLYPFELSGGMCQKVALALSLIAEPQLLVADEPTTALDPTAERDLLNLIEHLVDSLGISVLLVTHDLRIVKKKCRSVTVLLEGLDLETGPVENIFAHGARIHPYTSFLIECAPSFEGLGARLGRVRGTESLPQASRLGCPAWSMCGDVRGLEGLDPRCSEEIPPRVEVESGHWLRCWLCFN